MTIIRFL